MASIKIVRRKNKQKKDGTAPLALRISKDYQTHYTFLGQYVLEKDWDSNKGKIKNSYHNAKRLNNFLLKKLTEANDFILDAQNKISTKEIKDKISNKTHRKSFFQVAIERIYEKYECGNYSVATADLPKLYNLKEFLNYKKSQPKEKAIQEIAKNRKERNSFARRSNVSFYDRTKGFKKDETLYFENIDTAFIYKYKIFCKTYLNQKTRTITNQLIFIRTLFNRAIKDGIVDKKYYPFAGEKEKIRMSSSLKIGLTIEEIEKIEILELEPDSTIWHTHNVWLIAFYFAGIRISDVLELKWSDFKDGRLMYTMNKNEKSLSLKVPDKAFEILNLYKPSKKTNNGYIFPFLAQVNQKDSKDMFTKSRNASRLFNKYLKRIATICEIDKNISNHIARHSFGNIAGDAIHPLMLQKLYRHSDLKTTLNYQANFIHKEADDALDAVINFNSTK
jgi:integrase